MALSTKDPKSNPKSQLLSAKNMRSPFLGLDSSATCNGPSGKDQKSLQQIQIKILRLDFCCFWVCLCLFYVSVLSFCTEAFEGQPFSGLQGSQSSGPRLCGAPLVFFVSTPSDERFGCGPNGKGSQTSCLRFEVSAVHLVLKYHHFTHLQCIYIL